MTAPLEPIRGPLVEPAAPAHAVVRRREENPHEQPRRRREDEPQPEADDEEPGLHVDILA